MPILVFFVCSRTSSCGEIIFLESYENLQTTEYFYFVPAYCTLYIEKKPQRSKNGKIVSGCKSQDYLKTLITDLSFSFLPIKGVLVWFFVVVDFCFCFDFFSVQFLRIFEPTVHTYIYSLYTIQTYFSNAFECEEKTNVTLEHLKTFLHDLSLTFVLKWAIVNRFSPK